MPDSHARGEFRGEPGSCRLRNLTGIYINIYIYTACLLLARAKTFRSRTPRKPAFWL